MPGLTERERSLITGMSMTIVSKLLHSAIVRIRDKAVENRAEALTHAKMLDELFELRSLNGDPSFHLPAATPEEATENARAPRQGLAGRCGPR